MLAFRSLDPFRALREPDRRRRDEERPSRSEQRTGNKTKNNHLTGKAPYKFESAFLQRTVCELSVPPEIKDRCSELFVPRTGRNSSTWDSARSIRLNREEAAQRRAPWKISN